MLEQTLKIINKACAIVIGKWRLSHATPEGSRIEDKRRFDRFVGPFGNALTVKLLRTEKVYIVKDISYGGLAFIDPTRTLKLASSDAEPVEICILDRRIQTKMSTLSVRGDCTACLFHHDSPDTLLFLRESLEGFRKGLTVREVPQNLLQEKYRNGEWTYLRGTGPTDILFRRDDKGGIDSALVTFHTGDHYAEVRLNKGILETGRTMDREGAPAARMGATEKLDVSLLHHVACTLMTVKVDGADALVQQLLSALNSKLSTGKTAA